MKKLASIFFLIIISNAIFAQTEMQKFLLPDTSKFLPNIKIIPPQSTTISNDFKNLYPSKLPIPAAFDSDLTMHDSAKTELPKPNVSADLLFVRSVYFSPTSKLFEIQSTEPFKPKTDEEWGEKISVQITKEFKEKILPTIPRRMTIGLPFLEDSKIRKKARAKKRMTYQY